LCPEKLGNKTNFSNTTERVRDVWHTLWLLREVWMKVGLEKLESHKGVAVKALLDSGATGLFMNTAFAKEKGFRMERLKNPLLVRNVDRTVNVRGAIIYQVECNMFFKGHVERVRMDVCNLGKMEVILGMPWLTAHNPEIDWKKGEVRMMRCPPICGKKKQEEERKEVKKAEKNKDEEVLRRLVPKRFWRWKKVFRKKEDTSTKGLGPCNRIERRLHAAKRESVLIVKGRERGSTSICGRSVEKGIYSTF